MTDNWYLWSVLLITPLVCFIAAFAWKHTRKIFFTTGVVLYICALGVLYRFKALAGNLITQQQCDTQNVQSISNFTQCGFMVKDTIDLTKKAVNWVSCLEKIDQLKGSPTEAAACKQIGGLYNTTVSEWTQELDEYNRKMSQ